MSENYNGCGLTENGGNFYPLSKKRNEKTSCALKLVSPTLSHTRAIG